MNNQQWLACRLFDRSRFEQRFDKGKAGTIGARGFRSIQADQAVINLQSCQSGHDMFHEVDRGFTIGDGRPSLAGNKVFKPGRDRLRSGEVSSLESNSVVLVCWKEGNRDIGT